MIYGYIRVSSDKQTVENQRFEINNFCKRENIKIDGWICSNYRLPLGILVTLCKEMSYPVRSKHHVNDIVVSKHSAILTPLWGIIKNDAHSLTCIIFRKNTLFPRKY